MWGVASDGDASDATGQCSDGSAAGKQYSFPRRAGVSPATTCTSRVASPPSNTLTNIDYISRFPQSVRGQHLASRLHPEIVFKRCDWRSDRDIPPWERAKRCAIQQALDSDPKTMRVEIRGYHCGHKPVRGVGARVCAQLAKKLTTRNRSPGHNGRCHFRTRSRPQVAHQAAHRACSRRCSSIYLDNETGNVYTPKIWHETDIDKKTKPFPTAFSTTRWTAADRTFDPEGHPDETDGQEDVVRTALGSPRSMRQSSKLQV